MTNTRQPLLDNVEQWLSRFSFAILLLAVFLVSYGTTLKSPEIITRPTPAKPAIFAPMRQAVDPVRLVVPMLHIAAPIVPIVVENGVLDPPRNVKDVGWWRYSAKAGARTGQTVITGHTVHTGGGAVDNIRKLTPGRAVWIVTAKGTMRYRVTLVEVLSKRQVSEQAERLFGQKGGNGRLVLITCTDWNGRYYKSNVIVYGAPLGVLVKAAVPGGKTVATSPIVD